MLHVLSHMTDSFDSLDVWFNWKTHKYQKTIKECYSEWISREGVKIQAIWSAKGDNETEKFK